MKRLGKLFRKWIAGSFILNIVENRILRKSPLLKIPPVFIIGAPRSGSTLLYQYLISKYQFAYIPNLVSIFYKSPLLIFKLFNKNKLYTTVDFSSQYGYVEGIWSPSEAGKILEYWFDNPGINHDQIRKTVYAISSVFQAPLLIKNMNNTLRLDKIIEVFPDVIIIELKRDLVYNAQSILLARKKIKGRYNIWWPRKPFNYMEIKNIEPFLQVFKYLETMDLYVKRTIMNFPHVRYTEICYEEFCKEPATISSRIIKLMKQSVREKNSSMVRELKHNNCQQMNDTEFTKLNSIYEDYFRA